MLISDSVLMWIIEADNHPVGQIRFNRKNHTRAEVSVYLIPGETGRGRGTKVISEACKIVIGIWEDLKFINAKILKNNIRSQKAFERAGFVRASNEDSKQLSMELRL